MRDGGEIGVSIINAGDFFIGASWKSGCFVVGVIALGLGTFESETGVHLIRGYQNS